MGFVLYEQKGAIGVITINRPEALNALNSQVLEDLESTFKSVNLDEVRDYCQSLNWPSDSIARVVDWYCRPTRLRLTCGLKWETEDLKEIWERKC